MSTKPNRLKIIYIATLGYSGSTLIDLLINNHSAVQSTGEVMFLDEWMNNNLLCSCKSKIRDCSFWNDVIGRINDRDYYITDSKIDSFIQKYTNFSFIRKSKQFQYAMRTYELFKAVQEITGAKYVLDSSKILGRLKLLALSDLFEIWVIHLIRNGLAVACSHLVPKDRPSYDNGMKTKTVPVYKTAIKWALFNRAAEKYQGTKNIRFFKLRYEDLVKQPVDTMQTIFEWLGLECPHIINYPITDNIHNISGSRWRYNRNVKIRDGDAWKKKVTFRMRLIFAMIAGIQMKRYGYRSFS